MGAYHDYDCSGMINQSIMFGVNLRNKIVRVDG